MEFSFILILISLIAGALTVFAPCIFTFLPIILGSSSISGERKVNYKKILTIVISLALSVFIFSIALKASTLLINIDQKFWDMFAGLIIGAQGLIILFPALWDRLSLKIGFSRLSQNLNKAENVGGSVGDILTGMALGPIFSSCSPTYGFIIGILLQSTFSIGLVYLVFYILGLCLLLLAIGVLGQKLVLKLKWGTNPNGVLKKFIGIVFLIIGILIFTSFYKEIETFIINDLPLLDITQIDRKLLTSI